MHIVGESGLTGLTFLNRKIHSVWENYVTRRTARPTDIAHQLRRRGNRMGAKRPARVNCVDIVGHHTGLPLRSRSSLILSAGHGVDNIQ